MEVRDGERALVKLSEEEAMAEQGEGAARTIAIADQQCACVYVCIQYTVCFCFVVTSYGWG